MDYDTMVINDGNIKKTIYVLVEINKEHHYIIYTDKILKEINEEDIYIGEIINDELHPVSNDVKKQLETLIMDIINKKLHNKYF